MKKPILFDSVMFAICSLCFFNAYCLLNFSVSESLQTVQILLTYGIIVVLKDKPNVEQTNN